MLGWSNHYLGINQYSVELTCLAQGHKMVPQPGPEVIKLFSISAQLSMKFQLLINVEIIKISGKFRFKTQKLVIYPANKCLNANNCWHFNIYEQDKFLSQLS